MGQESFRIDSDGVAHPWKDEPLPDIESTPKKSLWKELLAKDEKFRKENGGKSHMQVSLEKRDEEDKKINNLLGKKVQWINQGATQWEESRKVVALSDDKKWAFVEGSKTGIPLDQLEEAA